jgi:DNA processing protein
VSIDPWLIRLNAVPGLGPLARMRLQECFPTSRAIFESSARTLARVPGVTHRLAEKILACGREMDVDDEIRRCEEGGIRIVARTDPEFPPALAHIPDPPPLLYARGRDIVEESPSIAVIGARRCSSYGRRQARRFATGLARGGVTVVSGLARGVDSIAHRGALEAGGRTVAVLGSGLDRIYPREHEGLAKAISDAGCVLSEFPLGTPPLRHHFPRRNRIIAGLSFGVVVIEAARKSGSLITALLAIDGGREVFAVPGPVDSSLSKGTHRLLREGARLVESPDEILEELGLAPEDATADGATVGPSDPTARRVLEAIPLDRSVLVDDVVQTLDLPAGAVLGALGLLAIEGRAAPEEGGRWARSAP